MLRGGDGNLCGMTDPRGGNGTEAALNQKFSDPTCRLCLTDFYVRLDRVLLPCRAWPINPSPGQAMDKLYFGLGAALYLVFVAWCIIAPQK
jgi:hypothetical protein